MQPQLKLLEDTLVERIIVEGFELLQDPGVKVYSDEGLELLAGAGADVDLEAKVARIPQPLVEAALKTAPSSFALYDGDGSVAGNVSLFPIPARTDGATVTISGTISAPPGTTGTVRLLVAKRD